MPSPAHGAGGAAEQAEQELRPDTKGASRAGAGWGGQGGLGPRCCAGTLSPSSSKELARTTHTHTHTLPHTPEKRKVFLEKQEWKKGNVESYAWPVLGPQTSWHSSLRTGPGSPVVVTQQRFDMNLLRALIWQLPGDS